MIVIIQGSQLSTNLGRTDLWKPLKPAWPTSEPAVYDCRSSTFGEKYGENRITPVGALLRLSGSSNKAMNLDSSAHNWVPQSISFRLNPKSLFDFHFLFPTGASFFLLQFSDFLVVWLSQAGLRQLIWSFRSPILIFGWNMIISNFITHGSYEYELYTAPGQKCQSSHIQKFMCFTKYKRNKTIPKSTINQCWC